MIVNYQKEIEIVNACDAKYDNNDLCKAIAWYSDKPVCRLKTVFLSGKYPAVSIYFAKIHIHRLLMMYYLNGEIPDSFYVHHNDGDRMNCTKENLSLVNISYHQRLHNIGKTISESQKDRIRECNRLRWAKRRLERL